jgi:tRNA 2-thiouridine synthesizing protein A
MTNNHPEIILDVSGQLCPLPVLRARKKLLAMAAGQVLVVKATDPMAAIDMPHFCSEQGHHLLSCEKTGAHLHFRIRCGQSAV